MIANRGGLNTKWRVYLWCSQEEKKQQQKKPHKKLDMIFTDKKDIRKYE